MANPGVRGGRARPNVAAQQEAIRRAEQRQKIADRKAAAGNVGVRGGRTPQPVTSPAQRGGRTPNPPANPGVRGGRAAPKPAPAPSYSPPEGAMMNTASFSGADSGGGMGGGMVAPVEPPPPPPAPVIPDVASDATYQAQVAELAKAMADREAQHNLGIGQYDTNYNGGLKKLGWNGQGFDRNDMQGLYGQALSDNTNDFAARGMLRSGAFADADSRLNNDFAERKTDIDTARQQFIDAQNQDFGNYKGQNALSKQAAQREAVARIAAQLGVSLDQVPLGAV